MTKNRKIIKRDITPLPADGVWPRVAFGTAVLALIGGVFAFYGSVADGSYDSWYGGSDIMATLLVLRDIWGDSGYDPLGWRTSVAPAFFPDYLLMHVGYAIGLDGLALFRFYGVALVIIATVGWIMVADKVLGRAWVTRAFVVLTMALHLVAMAFGGASVLVVGFFALFHHCGLWALMPYLLWLLLAVSESAKPKIWQTSLLSVLLGLAWFSDALVVPWFILPAVAILLFAFYVAPMRARSWRHLLGVLLVAYLIRMVVTAGYPFTASANVRKFTSFNPEQLFTTLSQMFSMLGEFATRHPLLFFCWVMFFVLLAVVLVALVRVLLARKTKRKQDMDNMVFVIIFFALSVVAGPAAVVATGSNVFAPPVIYIGGAMRYLHPTLLLPLFAGWVFLLAGWWRVFPSWHALWRRQQLSRVAIGLSVLLLAFATPKMIALVHDHSRLQLFDTPFFTCLQETAQRRKLRAGVASFWFDHSLAVASVVKEFGIERIARIGNLQRLGYQGKHSLYVSEDTTNRHYAQGDFDFAVVNAHQGTVYKSPWPNNKNACKDDGNPSCTNPGAYGFIIDGKAVEGQFGPPAEIVNCGAAALYIYDKPFTLQKLPRG